MSKKVSIRSLNNGSIIGTIILAVLCVLIFALGLQEYTILRHATQDYIQCETSARNLQNGSDILTKRARLAVSNASHYYVESYFEEANTTQTREKALQQLALLDSDTDAVDSLRAAFSLSNELMNTEYRSMRLVEEAIHTDPALWPEELKEVTLSDNESALSDEGRLRLAQDLLCSQCYETSKDKISNDIRAARVVLTKEIVDRQNRAANVCTRVFRFMFACIILAAAFTLFNGLIMRYWIVRPLVRYTDSIRRGFIFPLRGVHELQILADTYNKVYQENKARERLMKYQAEHDPLTGALNRGSFDRLLELSEKDGVDFALLLIDVDAFKSVNDTCGHAAGDAILKEVARLLKTAFRSIDHICRIGGDEFAVIMVGMTSDLAYVIEEKISAINAQLSQPKNGLPAVSLSVGAAFTDRENPGPDLFHDADTALYYTKEHGRHGCNIYPV